MSIDAQDQLTRSPTPQRAAGVNSELVTLFNKRPGGQIVAIEMTRADAEHAISRWPFAWSTSPSSASFARWPWPARARPRRGGRTDELGQAPMNRVAILAALAPLALEMILLGVLLTLSVTDALT